MTFSVISLSGFATGYVFIKLDIFLTRHRHDSTRPGFSSHDLDAMDEADIREFGMDSYDFQDVCVDKKAAPSTHDSNASKKNFDAAVLLDLQKPR